MKKKRTLKRRPKRSSKENVYVCEKTEKPTPSYVRYPIPYAGILGFSENNNQF